MKNVSSYKYQDNCTRLYAKSTLDDFLVRKAKAEKIIAVLCDFVGRDINQMSCLDVGCSTGWITVELGNVMKSVVGIDIEKEAICVAQKRTKLKNVKFLLGDSLNIPADNESFDVVVCNHVYEHVPDPKLLTEEISRVLRPKGACFFAGPNKLWPIEPHYRLWGLSLLPKFIADFYVRIFRGQDEYYENLMTYWELKKLLSQFKIKDYTSLIVKDPERFKAKDIVNPNSIKGILAFLLSEAMPWFSPTFVWMLRKK
jgi:2-polyprenyl-3-methyl-5-hydroxy-6-metoxy-1,4-benzoquinol methylase